MTEAGRKLETDRPLCGIDEAALRAEFSRRIEGERENVPSAGAILAVAELEARSRTRAKAARLVRQLEVGSFAALACLLLVAWHDVIAALELWIAPFAAGTPWAVHLCMLGSLALAWRQLSRIWTSAT